MSADQRHWIRTFEALLVAAVIFSAAVLLPKFLVSNLVLRLATTQGLELSLSMAAVAWLGKGRFFEYGFRLPSENRPETTGKRHWLAFGLGALVLGIIASVVMMFSGGGGNPLIKKLTFPQVILFVWILSSTIEELFTRGFVQSHLEHLGHVRVWLAGLKVPLPILISACVFACMHLVLLLSGADLTTVVIILLFTFSVGLLAGYQRAITGSLIPAIGVHMLANIGGVIGGVIYAIVRIMTGGPLPQM